MASRPGEESFRRSSIQLQLRSDSPSSSQPSTGGSSSSNGSSSQSTTKNGVSVLHRPRPKQGGLIQQSQSPLSRTPFDHTAQSEATSSSAAAGFSQARQIRASQTAANSSESEEEGDGPRAVTAAAASTSKTPRRNSFFGIAVRQEGDDDDDGDRNEDASSNFNATAQSSERRSRGELLGAAIFNKSSAVTPPMTTTTTRTSSSTRPSMEDDTSQGRPSISSSSIRTGSDNYGHRDERRSSFYGLDDHLQPETEDIILTSRSGSTHTPSSSHSSSLPPQQRLYQHHAGGAGGDSGSGSYSSHELRTSSGAATTSSSSNSNGTTAALGNTQNRSSTAKYYNAPYATSTAASLYNQPGIANSSTNVIETSQSSARLLSDQSHLQPGALASLLSHEKTLDLYRANAKKTDDPDIQFELCTFTMELVAEMEAVSGIELGTQVESGIMDSTGAVTTGLPSSTSNVLTKDHNKENIITDLTSRQKQQELVAESVTLLNRLATRGHVKSQYFLADCYTQGVGTAKGKRDYDKAFPLFMLAGKHGHSDACFRAAQCCENAWGTKKDHSKAVTLYRRAAVLNHPGAMHRLGLAEMNGEIGLARRPREGVKWLKRAAELADQVDPPQPQSLHELAILHEKGIDNVVFKDEEYAAELLARAAELYFAPSAYKLGECYEYGKMGCPQDSALSIHYYNIAAQQDHREACFALTAWYLVGSPGVLPQSDAEAYLWARKAAALELAKAEYAVGYFTEMGIGTHKDAREALEWFRKAAGHGDKRAIDRLRMAGAPIDVLYARSAPVHQHTGPTPHAPASAYRPPPQTRPAPSKTESKSFGILRGKRNKSIDTTTRSTSSNYPNSSSNAAANDRGRPYDRDLDAALRATQDVGRPTLPRQRSVSQPSFSPDRNSRAYQSQQQQSRSSYSNNHRSDAQTGPPTPPKMPASQASWNRSNSPSGSPSRGSPSRGGNQSSNSNLRQSYASAPNNGNLVANSRSLPPGAGAGRTLPPGAASQPPPQMNSFSETVLSPLSNGNRPVQPAGGKLMKQAPTRQGNESANAQSGTVGGTGPAKGFWRRK